MKQGTVTNMFCFIKEKAENCPICNQLLRLFFPLSARTLGELPHQADSGLLIQPVSGLQIASWFRMKPDRRSGLSKNRTFFFGERLTQAIYTKACICQNITFEVKTDEPTFTRFTYKTVTVSFNSLSCEESPSDCNDM